MGMDVVLQPAALLGVRLQQERGGLLRVPQSLSDCSTLGPEEAGRVLCAEIIPGSILASDLKGCKSFQQVQELLFWGMSRALGCISASFILCWFRSSLGNATEVFQCRECSLTCSVCTKRAHLPAPRALEPGVLAGDTQGISHCFHTRCLPTPQHSPGRVFLQAAGSRGKVEQSPTFLPRC